MNDTQIVDRFQRARKNKSLAVIEGIQALKHAIRFGAVIDEIITCDMSRIERYVTELAPDIKQATMTAAIEVSEETFVKLSPQPPRTKIIGLAKRRIYEIKKINPQKPIVFLENPKDLENIGAVIRVAAAADAAAVVVSGTIDMWHPAIIRGAAGLLYAVPVFQASLEEISSNRSIIALDPLGKNIQTFTIPNTVVLVFGTERYGISKSTLERSDVVLSLPMKQGVSSLNLATSVAATLYML